MGCLNLNEDDYVRINHKMAFYTKDNEKNTDYKRIEEMIVDTVQKALNEQKRSDEPKGFWKRHGQTVVSCVITAICTAVLSVLGNYVFLWADINNLKTQMNSVSTEVGDVIEEVSDISDYLYNDEGVKDQLGDINEALNLKVINVIDEDTVSVLDDVTIEENGISHTTSSLKADMTLGVDSNGHVFIAEELIGETILLTYKDEGKDVFFLGQYTQDYLWDGYCVTNAYNSDGTLYGICEMNYNNGKRLDYKTIMSNGGNKWGYYSRDCNGDVNAGVSIEYIFEYNKEKNFTNTNVRIVDIMYVDKFMEIQDKTMTQYYCGNTSKVKYNDDTGNAYLIKFDEDGTVKTLYVGRFKNGQLQDESGDAWNIVYWDDGGYYVCNTGVFRENHAINHSIDKLTLEQIEEKIKEIDIPFELVWKN